MSLEDIANDVAQFRLYTVALATLQVYDYWLTLSDEIQYAWEGRKTWVFYLFLFNRYAPIVYQFWSLFATFWTGYTQEVRCDRSAFIHMFLCVMFTLLVQVILIARIYAITLKHKLITGCFILATTLQFGLGVFMTYEVAGSSSHPVAQLDFSDGHLCIYVEHRIEELVYTAMSLFFDVGIFIVVAVRLLWRRPSSIRMPSIIRAILRDATIYVLFLCTSRIIFVFLSVFTADQGHITRFTGNNTFVSIMITRMLLSLKRTAANTLDQGWGVGGNEESTLDLPSLLRTVHGTPHSSNPVSRAQPGSAFPIPMEIIHIRVE